MQTCFEAMLKKDAVPAIYIYIYIYISNSLYGCSAACNVFDTSSYLTLCNRTVYDEGSNALHAAEQPYEYIHLYVYTALSLSIYIYIYIYLFIYLYIINNNVVIIDVFRNCGLRSGPSRGADGL